VTRILLLLICLASGVLQAKQEVDLGFVPKNNKIVSKDKIVLVDEAHHNFHTLDGLYKPFAKVLESAGYIVEKNINKFTSKSLKR
jgi:hypothetical protein